MPEHDLDLLKRIATGAGHIARGFFEGANRVWEKGHDDPVSEADLAVDTYLRETLLAARPDYGWLSEETADTHNRLGARRLFIVDPIDGTRAFVAGEASWAHSLAVVEDGDPIAAVVFLPMKSRVYAAARNGGATCNGAPITASSMPNADGARVLASRPTFQDRFWKDGAPPIERHFRPSLAYRMSLVAEGRFDGMITLRDSWEWDIAAGALIAAEAGALVSDRHGCPLRFNNPNPKTPGVLAAARGLHADLADRLAIA
ncbi:MAG: 3'(2'),5'-bisphosphate nucleotidase CysQ [Pseudomonadota bacterium]